MVALDLLRLAALASIPATFALGRLTSVLVGLRPAIAAAGLLLLATPLLLPRRAAVSAPA